MRGFSCRVVGQTDCGTGCAAAHAQAIRKNRHFFFPVCRLRHASSGEAAISFFSMRRTEPAPRLRAAINMLPQNVAPQYGKHNFRCNAIMPGFILTEGGKKFIDDSQIAMLTRHTLLPRIGTLADIAAAVPARRLAVPSFKREPHGF